MKDLTRLPPWDDDGSLRVVVETPRGSTVKISYDPELGAMKLKRALVLGAIYPYDFGFVPGTRAPDGDPLDVLLLLDAPTFPGVVVLCRPIGVLQVSQKDGKRRVRNDRLIAVACVDRRHADVEDVADLPAREREEIEVFFRTAVALEGKDLRVEGWGDASRARDAIGSLADRGRPSSQAKGRRNPTQVRPKL